jgi:hypothetical protein
MSFAFSFTCYYPGEKAILPLLLAACIQMSKNISRKSNLRKM